MIEALDILYFGVSTSEYYQFTSLVASFV